MGPMGCGTQGQGVGQAAGACATAGSILLGDLALKGGGVLRNARMGYRTWGTLNEAGDNAVVLPSYFSGTCDSYAPWVGQGALFDPARWYVVAYDQLGAGASSKPSADGGLGAWPGVQVADSVRAARMLVGRLGVTSVRLVCGWSMGGMQAFAWHALFPGMVRAALALCATPSCNPVNAVFLDGIRSILVQGADAELDGLPARDLTGRLRAFGQVYAGWAYSDEFFLKGLYRDVGYGSADQVLQGWAADHEGMDARDLVAQLDAWRTSPNPYALAHCQANSLNMLAMPCSTDRYFLPQAIHAGQGTWTIPVQVLESPLGHIAGRPGIRPEEGAALQGAVGGLLQRTEGENTAWGPVPLGLTA